MPMPKADGGDDDQPVLLLERGFHAAAFHRIKPRVIGQRVVPGLAHRLGQRFRLGPSAAVDDPRLPLARGGIGQHLRPRIVLHGKGQTDVRPVESAQEGHRVGAAEQPVHDLGPGVVVGGGSEGRHGDAQRLPQRTDAQVVGAEIVAPLRDAMRLVHRDGGDARTAGEGRETGGGKAFRRNIKELQVTAFQCAVDGLGFSGVLPDDSEPAATPAAVRART